MSRSCLVKSSLNGDVGELSTAAAMEKGSLAVMRGSWDMIKDVSSQNAKTDGIHAG